MIEKPGGTRTVRLFAGGLASSWAWAVHGESEFNPRGGVLVGYDALSLAGEKVSLRGRLWRKRILPRAVKGRKVRFSLGKELLGTVATGAEGLAEFYFSPLEHQDYYIRLELEDSEDFPTPPAALLVGSRPKRAPTIILDIDGTLADASIWEVPFRANRNIPALAGAAEVVWALARKYSLLYLTGRDDFFLQKTKEWLDLRGFPRAPIFFWDPEMRLATPAGYKMHTIALLKRKWPNLVFGIGDRPSDAEAYLSSGLGAYLIGRPRRKVLPEVVFSPAWKELGAKLGIRP